MRELKTNNKHVTISVKDEPGQGGACHEYCLSRSDDKDVVPVGEFGHISFQNGPIKEFGVNGCQQEDLIAICIDRLRSFQSGPYPCRENAIALTKLEEALMWLESRTKDRVFRGVEGINRD